MVIKGILDREASRKMLSAGRLCIGIGAIKDSMETTLDESDPLEDAAFQASNVAFLLLRALMEQLIANGAVTKRQVETFVDDTIIVMERASEDYPEFGMNVQGRALLRELLAHVEAISESAPVASSNQRGVGE
jgi:hypothetical protein